MKVCNQAVHHGKRKPGGDEQIGATFAGNQPAVCPLIPLQRPHNRRTRRNHSPALLTGRLDFIYGGLRQYVMFGMHSVFVEAQSLHRAERAQANIEDEARHAHATLRERVEDGMREMQ